MTTAFLVCSLFLFLGIGMPIAIALGLSSTLAIIFFTPDSLASVALKFFGTMEHYTLLAMPFFILSSAFLTTGGVAKRLINFATAAVGHVPGGLAVASVFACVLFAAISGSSPATVVAVGSIVIAGMIRTGYTPTFAAGCICTAGTLGILIPPSIPMIAYAATTETSVGRLFMAGTVPGLLLALVLMVSIYLRAKWTGLARMPKSSWAELVRTGREAIWGILLIVIIMGGIYGGIFTPTEAAAVAAVYSFVIAVWVYRDCSLKQVPDVLLEAGKITVMLLFIVGNAFLFAHVLTSERIPEALAQHIIEANLEPWMFLLLVNILLLIAGNFMEPIAVILILAPVIMPVASSLGIDPVHLGIIFVVNMEIGMITPPVGLNLFITSGITGMSIMQVVRAVLPWLAIMLAFLMLVTYVPWLSLALPDFLFGPETAVHHIIPPK
ncbi:MAG: TRAP transporter large permease [Flavobacteriaceae bacterium]